MANGNVSTTIDLQSKLIDVNNSFIKLPYNAANKLLSEAGRIPFAMLVDQGGGTAKHVAWNGETSENAEIEIPSALAQLLGIKGGSKTHIRVAHLGTATKAEVDASTDEGRTAIHNNPNMVESNLVSQIGVLDMHDAIPFFPPNDEPLTLKVSSVEPSPAALPVSATELSVGRGSKKGSPGRSSSQGETIQLRVGVRNESSDVNVTMGQMRLKSPRSTEMLINRSDAEAMGIQSNDEKLVACFRVSQETNLSKLQPAYATAKSASGIRKGEAMVSSPLLASWVAAPGSVLQFRTITKEERNQLTKQGSIKLHSQSNGSQVSDGPTPACESLKQSAHSISIKNAVRSGRKQNDADAPARAILRAWTKARGSAVLCQGTQIILGDAAFTASVDAGTGAGAMYIDDDLVASQRTRIELGPPRPLRKPVMRDEEARPKVSEASMSLLNLVGYKELADSNFRRVKKAFKMSRSHGEKGPRPGGILITGAKESGRSAFAQSLCQRLADDEETTAAITPVSCPALYKREPQQAREALVNAACDSLARAPAVVFLDDIDSLVTHESHYQSSSAVQSSEEGDGGAMMHAHDVVSMLDFFNSDAAWKENPVIVIATAKTRDALPKALVEPSRFDSTLELPSLTSADVAELAITEAKRRSLAFDGDMGDEDEKQLEGFTAADVRHVIDRAADLAAAEDLPEGTLPLRCFREALNGVLPAGVRSLGAAQQKGLAGQKMEGWKSVGGLRNVQEHLVDQLELPTKHADVFKDAPIRLPTGALLYGPPGCGKTLVARAAASAASLRIVSIKGPELLNKYIGASEASVRSLFQRARAAAPCILFFDEFDSIAPKRGQDNTGVTDRVVNQLLTELDGVESLVGVYVLAATSRPDLIDTALLRPGRLDRMLYCGFPNPDEREEILNALAKGIKGADKVDLKALARDTEGMSGADIKGLLADAQLRGIERADGGVEGVPGVSQADVDGVLENARVSISRQERSELEQIYREFRSSPGESFEKPDWANQKAQFGTKSALY